MKEPIDERSNTPQFRDLFPLILYHLTSLIKNFNDDKLLKKLVHHSKIIKILCYLKLRKIFRCSVCNKKIINIAICYLKNRRSKKLVWQLIRFYKLLTCYFVINFNPVKSFFFFLIETYESTRVKWEKNQSV